jgi:hypothetical protein
MLSHDRAMGDFIPIWERVFDPTTDTVVNTEARTINMWAPSEHIKQATKTREPTLNKCPLINKIISSCVGTGSIQEHFLNWLAVIMQHRTKPRTGWVLHGNQGTGKGLLINKILAPLFGKEYVVVRMQNELKSDFSAFIEFALIAFIDEIEVDALQDGGLLEAKLKHYITEPTVSIRRMRTDSYSVPSYTGWIFGSNKSQPVVIPRNDRRYNVGQYQRSKLEITLEEVEQKLPLEIQAFADYLFSRVADKDVACRPLLTEDRETLMALSETSVEKTANAITMGDLELLWDAMPDEKLIDALHHSSTAAMAAQAYINFLKRAVEDAYNGRPTRTSREELGAVFQHCVGNVPTSAHKLTTYLSHYGIHLVRLRDTHEGTRMYGKDIEWHVAKEFLDDVYVPPKPTPRASRVSRVQGSLRAVK